MQGVLPSFIGFRTSSSLWNQVPAAGLSESSESSSSCCDGFPAAFPSTRRSMHPSIALETSTLRRVSLAQYSSCCLLSPKLSASPDFQMQSDSMRWKNLSLWKKIDSSLQVAAWTQLFFFLIMNPLRHCGALSS